MCLDISFRVWKGEDEGRARSRTSGYYKGLMIDEGVTVVEPTEEVLQGFRDKAKAFYDEGATFGWSDGLYDTVCAAMGK